MMREWKRINKKRITIVGFLITMMICSFLVNTIEAKPRVYYGRVVGTEFFIIQVKGDNQGRIFRVTNKKFFDKISLLDHPIFFLHHDKKGHFLSLS